MVEKRRIFGISLIVLCGMMILPFGLSQVNLEEEGLVWDIQEPSSGQRIYYQVSEQIWDEFEQLIIGPRTRYFGWEINSTGYDTDTYTDTITFAYLRYNSTTDDFYADADTTLTLHYNITSEIYAFEFEGDFPEYVTEMFFPYILPLDETLEQPDMDVNSDLFRTPNTPLYGLNESYNITNVNTFNQLELTMNLTDGTPNRYTNFTFTESGFLEYGMLHVDLIGEGKIAMWNITQIDANTFNRIDDVTYPETLLRNTQMDIFINDNLEQQIKIHKNVVFESFQDDTTAWRNATALVSRRNHQFQSWSPIGDFIIGSANNERIHYIDTPVLPFPILYPSGTNRYDLNASFYASEVLDGPYDESNFPSDRAINFTATDGSYRYLRLHTSRYLSEYQEYDALTETHIQIVFHTSVLQDEPPFEMYHVHQSYNNTIPITTNFGFQTHSIQTFGNPLYRHANISQSYYSAETSELSIREGADIQYHIENEYIDYTLPEFDDYRAILIPLLFYPLYDTADTIDVSVFANHFIHESSVYASLWDLTDVMYDQSTLTLNVTNNDLGWYCNMTFTETGTLENASVFVQWDETIINQTITRLDGDPKNILNHVSETSIDIADDTHLYYDIRQQNMHIAYQAFHLDKTIMVNSEHLPNYANVYYFHGTGYVRNEQANEWVELGEPWAFGSNYDYGFYHTATDFMINLLYGADTTPEMIIEYYVQYYDGYFDTFSVSGDTFLMENTIAEVFINGTIDSSGVLTSLRFQLEGVYDGKLTEMHLLPSTFFDTHPTPSFTIQPDQYLPYQFTGLSFEYGCYYLDSLGTQIIMFNEIPINTYTLEGTFYRWDEELVQWDSYVSDPLSYPNQKLSIYHRDQPYRYHLLEGFSIPFNLVVNPQNIHAELEYIYEQLNLTLDYTFTTTKFTERELRIVNSANYGQIFHIRYTPGGILSDLEIKDLFTMDMTMKRISPTDLPNNRLPEITTFTYNISDEDPRNVTFQTNYINLISGVPQVIWDFGDGTVMSGGRIVRHQYTEPGTYNITVTIIDPTWDRDSQTITLTIEFEEDDLPIDDDNDDDPTDPIIEWWGYVLIGLGSIATIGGLFFVLNRLNIISLPISVSSGSKLERYCPKGMEWRDGECHSYQRRK